MNSPLSLTVTSNGGRLKELKTDCVVFQPHRPEKTPPQLLKNIKGIKTIYDIKDLVEDGKELAKELVTPASQAVPASAGGFR